MAKDKAKTPKIEALDEAALDAAQGGLLPAVNVAFGDGSVRTVKSSITDGTSNAITDGTSNTLVGR